MSHVGRLRDQIVLVLGVKLSIFLHYRPNIPSLPRSLLSFQSRLKHGLVSSAGLFRFLKFELHGALRVPASL